MNAPYRLLLHLLLSLAALAQSQPARLLTLEKTIPMPDVQGRIDHLSIDVKGQRLFVAALGNNTLEVIDLRTGKVARSVPELKEPQGVLFLPDNNRVYVANGGDGSVRIYGTSSFSVVKTVPTSGDADNIRYDAAQKEIYVGFGNGALGIIGEDGDKKGEIALGAHPESFQLERNGSRIFVNLPKARRIAVVDRRSRTVIANWSTGLALSNYPMALDEEQHRLFVVCRSPARLLVLDTNTGKVVQKIAVIGDSDDVFYDRARKRIYAIGGEGAISVIQQQDPDHYTEVQRVTTIRGARTGLFSPEMDRLYVAARKENGVPAAIHVYKIQP